MTLSGVATLVETKKYKRIENSIYGDEGQLIYCGDDAEPSSGSLQVIIGLQLLNYICPTILST